MNDELPITAIEFYLRQQHHFTRTQSDPSQPMSEWAEQALWDYAQETARRLEQLRRRTAPQPVPVRRPNHRARRARHDLRAFPPTES